VLAQLKEDYPDKLRVIYRHFPLLSIHDKAALATQASEAAGAQGAFWEMHDQLYLLQSEWATTTPEGFQNWLLTKATELGLDIDQFVNDLNAETNVEFAQQAWAFGQEIGIRGTPFLLVNGNPYGGPLDYNSLDTIMKLILLEENQFSECPPLTIDPLKEYVATIETEKGDIIIRLFADKAPLAVNSFIFLAREGWFDEVTFHRVLPGFVAQAGDPSGTGFGGPGYAFDNEIDPNIRFDAPGLVGMANAGPGSNGSQFFVTLAPQPDLDGNFTIFGEVLTGLEVAESFSPRNPQPGVSLAPGDKILSVTIEER
jgi:cyclophilin family peptidyl-prolyl cis-trans isomerase